MGVTLEDKKDVPPTQQRSSNRAPLHLLSEGWGRVTWYSDSVQFLGS